MQTDLTKFSPKQLSLINHANTDRHLYLAGGSIRSGKTFSGMIGFSLWSLHKFPGYRFILSGVSIDAIKRNYADEMVEFMRSLGFSAKYHLSQGTKIIVPQPQGTPSVYHLIGANDKTASGRTQGLTIAGGFLDEIVLLPRDFVLQVMARQSVPGGKLWGTYNPENPAHWLKREVVNSPAKYRATVETFTFEDNPSLSDEVKERYRNTFTGHWHTRFVRGDWAAPAGTIFPHWHLRKTDPKKYNQMFTLSLDWAVSGIFAALLFGRTPINSQVICCDEFIHDARKDRVKTEDEIIVELVAWLGDRKVDTVWLDPSTPATFKRKLRNLGILVRNADNDVAPGLMTTASRLSRKSIVIHERCVHLREELDSYQWDADKAEIGEDAPIKTGDHAVDALRYFSHSTGKLAYLGGAGSKPKGM